ncbi:hypothetical protein TRVL_00626 [Trypanosoma vivax]|nr:hypothetical protein TRVL_00626 [Trypanosoma vivax]
MLVLVVGPGSASPSGRQKISCLRFSCSVSICFHHFVVAFYHLYVPTNGAVIFAFVVATLPLLACLFNSLYCLLHIQVSGVVRPKIHMSSSLPSLEQAASIQAQRLKDGALELASVGSSVDTKRRCNNLGPWIADTSGLHLSTVTKARW